MDFSSFFSAAKAKNGAFVQFGFETQGDSLVLRRDLAGTDFYAAFTVRGETMTAQVFERETGEKYALFDVERAEGAFVGEVREKVQEIAGEILQNCFEANDVRARYVAFIEREFGVSAEYPWAAKEGEKKGFKSERFSDFAVFRCPNKKWFALVMWISYKNLGFESDERVCVVNLKSDCAESVVDKKAIFPAYHMNKTYWITALLTSAADFDQLCALTKQSYALVSAKKPRR